LTRGPESEDQMGLAVFRCSTCCIALTPPLRLLTDVSMLSEQEGEDHLPAGYYYYWVAPPPDEVGGYYTDAAGEYLVHLKDAVNVLPHPDARRRNGCCGMDGCDGRNTVCANGHEVGIERSDCWLAHSLALDPSCVGYDILRSE
jgi:hypothetical protein